MFRIGENVYATQFHPEDDAEEFALRVDVYANHGYFEPHELEAIKKASSPQAICGVLFRLMRCGFLILGRILFCPIYLWIIYSAYF